MHETHKFILPTKILVLLKQEKFEKKYPVPAIGDIGIYL